MISKVIKAQYYPIIIDETVLRSEVVYVDCSPKALSACLNPAFFHCDPDIACLQGYSMIGIKTTDNLWKFTLKSIRVEVVKWITMIQKNIGIKKQGQI